MIAGTDKDAGRAVEGAHLMSRLRGATGPIVCAVRWASIPVAQAGSCGKDIAHPVSAGANMIYSMLLCRMLVALSFAKAEIE
jgi:hypothetical protein